MYEYDEECLKTFLKNQGQLFDEPVAETLEAAEAFLEDCMAVIVDNIGEGSVKLILSCKAGCDSVIEILLQYVGQFSKAGTFQEPIDHLCINLAGVEVSCRLG